MTHKISYFANICYVEKRKSYLIRNFCVRSLINSGNQPTHQLGILFSSHLFTLPTLKVLKILCRSLIVESRLVSVLTLFQPAKKKLFHGLPTPLSQQYLRISSIYRMSASETRECQVIATMLHTVGFIKSTTI